jgi:hypothetical protein
MTDNDDDWWVVTRELNGWWAIRRWLDAAFYVCHFMMCLGIGVGGLWFSETAGVFGATTPHWSAWQYFAAGQLIVTVPFGLLGVLGLRFSLPLLRRRRR